MEISGARFLLGRWGGSSAKSSRWRKSLHENWQQLAEVWRTRQLQYTWLRSLTGRHVDFWQITVEALEFALDSLKLVDPQLRIQLMELYLQISA